jgi:hypothetical protein
VSRSWPPAAGGGRPGASSAPGSGRSTPGGAPSTLGQLLGAENIHQALVSTKYQEQVVGADRAALDRVERLRRQLEALAARLADQAERQQRLQARLAAKRRQIEARLAAQRRTTSA